MDLNKKDRDMKNSRTGHKIIQKEGYVEHAYINLEKLPYNPSLLHFFYVCEGTLESGSEYSFPHGNTQCFHLEFSEGGELYFSSRRKVRKIEKDSVYIEHPGREKRYYTFRNTGKNSIRRYALAIFPNSNFEPIFHLQELDIVRNVNMEKLSSSIRSLIRRLKEKKECSPEEISINLFEILTFLTASNSSAENNSLSGTRKEKLSLVMTSPQSFPDLKSLLDFFKVSKETLYRIFRQYTGKSPMDFVITARLVNSCWMLLETQYPISEIAGISGYECVSFYSNAFKKLFGMSPSHCRKYGFAKEEARKILNTLTGTIYHLS